MGKKHLLPAENEDFLERLGLTEQDKEVYIATLDSGLVSAGEIQQLTEFKDLGKVLESIRDLIDIGLIKQAQGKMPRYYATLPFFREMLSVEREFKFALESMLQSLKQSKKQTTQNREKIIAVDFPIIVDDLLDKYYKHLLSPFIQNLKDFKEEIKNSTTGFSRKINHEIEGLKEEINLMVKPLLNYTNLQAQKFDIAFTNEENEIKQLFAERKKQRLDNLKEAHQAIAEYFNKFKQVREEISSNLSKISQQNREEIDLLEQSNTHINDILSELKSSSDQLNSLKNELTAEVLVARQKILKVVKGKDNEINNTFDQLNQKIKSITFSLDNHFDNLNKTKSNIENITTTHHNLDQLLTQSSNYLTDDLDQSLADLTKKMSEIFNTLNSKDEQSIQQFKEKLLTKISNFNSSIIDQTKEIREKIEDHVAEIKTQQDKSFGKFSEKMTLLYENPLDMVQPFLDHWVENVEPIIEKFKEKSDSALNDILEPILKLETETFSTLTERIGFVKAMIEGRANDLQLILDMAKEFDYSKISDTWVVEGLPSLYAGLTDLLLRAKTTITIVTPKLDFELVELAQKTSRLVRITFVAEIDPDRDKRLLKKLEDIGRINVRDFPDADLFACIRDAEEIIFGYVREGEETVGIRALTPSVVELIQDRLNETVLRNSKPV